MTFAARKRRGRVARMSVAAGRGRGPSATRATASSLLFASFAVHAQAAAPAEGPSVLPLLLTLVFVLALIPVAVWLLKRLGGGHVAGAAGLRVVAQLPLGQRERLVVVEAGERWLLLGVTAAAINRVGTLPKGELPAMPERAGFAALLRQARRDHDDA